MYIRYIKRERDGGLVSVWAYLLYSPLENDIPGIFIPERNPKPSTYWVAAAAAMEVYIYLSLLLITDRERERERKRSIDLCGKTSRGDARCRQRELFSGSRNQMEKPTLYILVLVLLLLLQSFSSLV